MVVLDEAHMIKNDIAERSIVLRWLTAYFNILMTATPCSNRGTDFCGFLNSIKPDHFQGLLEDFGGVKSITHLKTTIPLPKFCHRKTCPRSTSEKRRKSCKVNG
jgi:SNF2-related domain